MRHLADVQLSAFTIYFQELKKAIIEKKSFTPSFGWFYLKINYVLHR